MGTSETEKVEDYVLVEDVQKSWDRRDLEKAGSQRILDMSERVLQAQNRWKGRGKFILRKKSEVTNSVKVSTSRLDCSTCSTCTVAKRPITTDAIWVIVYNC